MAIGLLGAKSGGVTILVLKHPVKRLINQNRKYLKIFPLKSYFQIPDGFIIGLTETEYIDSLHDIENIHKN